MNKRSIGIFLASAVLTALLISLIVSLIMIEHNTLRLGFGKNEPIFCFEGNIITINGREYYVFAEQMLEVLNSNAVKILSAVFMVL